MWERLAVGLLGIGAFLGGPLWISVDLLAGFASVAGHDRLTRRFFPRV